MKTIWDAVNWLKGDLKNSYNTYIGNETSVFFDIEKGCFGTSAFTISCSDKGEHTCSIKEFNALVTEMSLGLDVNPVNEGYYHKYLDADKEELEPVPVIDWDNAPEGATHYCPSNKQFSEVFIKDLTDDGYSYKVVGSSYVDNEWGYTSPIVKGELHGIVKRPTKQQPNIYTQEMCDNGEHLKLGAKFKVVNIDSDSRMLDFKGLTVTVIGLSITENHKQVITFEHERRGIGCGVFDRFWVRPVPPGVELINGECYQFEYIDRGVCKGIYSAEHKAIIGHECDYPVVNCTNIKPLTVKGD